MSIVSIFAREILDSRGNPTVEVDLHTDKGSNVFLFPHQLCLYLTEIAASTDFLLFLLLHLHRSPRTLQGCCAQRCVHWHLRGPGAPRWRQDSLQGQRSERSVPIVSVLLFSSPVIVHSSPSCAAFVGVTKAVGHINDTLGPALVESVRMTANSQDECEETMK